MNNNSCRLCLAPGNECIPIFQNYAADRQRLDQKVLSCVQIEIRQGDHLSHKICHACISYLNSWQSFKNRCDAAEKKQLDWIETNDRNLKQSRNDFMQHVKELCPGVTIESIPHKIPSNEQSKTECQQAEVSAKDTKQQNDLSFIKTEADELEEYSDEKNILELDPAQFLLQSHNEENEHDYNDNESSVGHLPERGPLLLTSLGLHQISPRDGHMNTSDNEQEDDMESIHRQLASCSVCDMTFSNRANARRHERNIHGLRQNIANPLLRQVPHSLFTSNDETQSPQSINAMPDGIMDISKIGVKQKFKMKLKSQGETYDYSNPVKYRHLITPNRLTFILRNLEFLEQAQNMKCKCCNKTYPSYKYFMGHMRKKYQNLPRNVCFKCLRQFSSKGQFIGHLKRKSCINLYAIVMADDSIPKVLPSLTGTQEVISNKNYGCKLCNKEFKLKSHLRRHILEIHLQGLQNQQESSSCIFCKQMFEDTAVRKAHYNNFDCVMFIVCCSCGERFDSQSAYVEHVYENHLPSKIAGHDEYGYELFDQDGNSSSSYLRNPQNCPVCNKQYNNYYNVLRHMESKHPNQLPQIYQCTKCEEGFPRQSELRDHLHNSHGETTVRQQKQHISQLHTLCDDSNKVNFSCNECGKTLPSLSDWIAHQDTEHSKFSCIKCDLQTYDREIFAVHCFMAHKNFSSLNSKLQFYSCRQCSNSFNSIDSLQEHLQLEHKEIENYSVLEVSKNESETLQNIATADKSENIVGVCDDNVSNVTINENIDNVAAPISKTLNCRLCAFVLTDIEALRQHMTNIHGMDKKFFYCNQCSAKFMNDKGLRAHLFRLHGVRDETITLNARTSLLKPIQSLSAATDDKHITMNECDICHIVYKSYDQLQMHIQSTHANKDKNDGKEEAIFYEQKRTSASSLIPTPVWFQCRSCSECFNTSKKLTIHMNTHDEFDKSDHSCRDCNGVYSTKKSLWVHRYKKHPRIPDPSKCDVCLKVFFDKTELSFHASLAHATISNKNEINGISNTANGNDMQCAGDAHLSMLNAAEKGIEPSSHLEQKVDEALYQCDMCPKTFHILNALQVHRGWHFRSPDGRKVRDPNDIWQPDQMPPSKVKRMSHFQRTSSGTSKTTGTTEQNSTCPYCYSTFTTSDNLEQHIVEIHKRVDSKSVSHNGQTTTAAEVVKSSFVEKVRKCTACSLKFNSTSDWIEHKLNHIRALKPLEVTEWKCEICGIKCKRKEQLLQHISSHANNRQSSNTNSNRQFVEQRAHDEAYNVDDLTNIKHDESWFYDSKIKRDQFCIKNEDVRVKEEDEEDENQNNNAMEEDYVDEDEEVMDESHDDESQEGDIEDDITSAKQYFCELCQVYFVSANLLRQHVSEHFVNGGFEGSIVRTQRPSSNRSSSESIRFSKSSSNSSSSVDNSIDNST